MEGDLPPLLTGGGLLAALVLGALALLLGRRWTAPRPHSKPQVPPEPPPPDTSAQDAQAAVADHEAAETREQVDKALAGESEPDNPHGLADAVNRRRR